MSLTTLPTNTVNTMTAATKKTTKKARKSDAEAKPAPTPRVKYMDTELGERNDDGKLVGQPVNFDGKKHLKPSKDDFADELDFFTFQADQCEERVNYFTKQRDKWLETRESFAKYGDKKKRKIAQRADRLRAQLAALDAELAADDVEAVEA